MVRFVRSRNVRCCGHAQKGRYESQTPFARVFRPGAEARRPRTHKRTAGRVHLRPSIPCSESRRSFRLCTRSRAHGPGRPSRYRSLKRSAGLYLGPLEENLTAIGPVSLTLYAVTSAPDTDFTAKLCVVSPGGRSTNIQEGIVRARYRESLTQPTPITPDEVYEYKIDLGPTAYVFKTGQQIRVQVSSSNFPQWDRNLNTGGPLGAEGATQALVATQIVLHDTNHPSRLTLPVVSS